MRRTFFCSSSVEGGLRLCCQENAPLKAGVKKEMIINRAKKDLEERGKAMEDRAVADSIAIQRLERRVKNADDLVRDLELSCRQNEKAACTSRTTHTDMCQDKAVWHMLSNYTVYACKQREMCSPHNSSRASALYLPEAKGATIWILMHFPSKSYHTSVAPCHVFINAAVLCANRSRIEIVASQRAEESTRQLQEEAQLMLERECNLQSRLEQTQEEVDTIQKQYEIEAEKVSGSKLWCQKSSTNNLI